MTHQAFKQKINVITPSLVEGFVETFLLSTFDHSKVTPVFHRELWALMCSQHRQVAISAPRAHAKSTAGTVSFTLACLLFGFKDFVLIISATEEIVKPHLQNIIYQLEENDSIIQEFGVVLTKVTQTELEGKTFAGPFRIVCKGAGQKVRGLTWRQKRPNLIIVDDLEDDEQVCSKDQRDKLRDWFKNAVLPCGSDDAMFRVFGTILHIDSLLHRLLENPSWLSARFAAHKAFDDFSEILWPEKFSEDRLKAIRQEYIHDFNMSGYSREYLSQAIVEEDSYFKKDMFLPMSFEDHHKKMEYYVAVDFAITKSDRSDYTVITVGGMNSEGYLCIVDIFRFRGDGLEIIEKLFEVEKTYKPEVYLLERGQIAHSLGAFLKAEMLKRNSFLNLELITPIGDKVKRSRSIQKRMQMGGVKFNMLAPWYGDFFTEMITFDRGVHDDQVDTLSYLGLYLDKIIDVAPDIDIYETDNYRIEKPIGFSGKGKSPITGY